MSSLTSFLLVAFVFSSTIVAGIEDVFTISADHTNFTLSNEDEMKKILAGANLESLGYKKEEITITFKESKGNSINSTFTQYSKKIPCSDASKTFKELKDRISDARISALLNSAALDLPKRNISGCKIKIKVHSKTSKPGSKMADSSREKRGYWGRRRRWRGSYRRRRSTTCWCTRRRTTMYRRRVGPVRPV